MVVAFFKQTLTLALEVLLSHLRFLFFDALLSLEVFLSNIGVFLESGLIVLLRALQLTLHIFLSATTQSFQFTLNLLLFQFLAMTFDSQLFLETTAGLQLLGDGAHQ